jgi:hypothetical protein
VFDVLEGFGTELVLVAVAVESAAAAVASAAYAGSTIRGVDRASSFAISFLLMFNSPCKQIKGGRNVVVRKLPIIGFLVSILCQVCFGLISGPRRNANLKGARQTLPHLLALYISAISHRLRFATICNSFSHR